MKPLAYSEFCPRDCDRQLELPFPRKNLWPEDETTLEIAPWKDDEELFAEALAARFADVNRYPHSCPRCGGRAYVGFHAIEHAHGGPCK